MRKLAEPTLSFFRLPLILFTIALILNGCNILLPLDGELVSVSDTKQETGIRCPQGVIEWDGREFTPGRKLGEGVRGAVFELEENGSVTSEWVMKVYKGATYERVRRSAREDLEVAKAFPELFPKAYYLQAVPVNGSSSESFAAAFVLKEKAAGTTLWNLMSIMDQAPYMAPAVLESFLKFKQDLQTVLLSRLENAQLFLWDLHANNIMYSTSRNRWTVVDADMAKGFSVFKARIELLSNADESLIDHPIHKIKDLLAEYQSVPNEEFVAKLVDIYLKDFELMMEAKQTKYYEAN